MPHRRQRTTRVQRLMMYTADAAKQLQMHRHSHRCKKGDGEGTDQNCDLHMPQPQQQSTQMEPDCIALRRHHDYVVSFMPALLLAEACNNNIRLFCDNAPWRRERWLWEQGGRQGPEPAPQRMEEAAHDAADYFSKYATKAINTDTNTPLFTAANTLAQAAAEQPVRRVLPASDQGRYNLAVAMNRVHGSITYSAPLCALFIMTGEDSWCSHETAVHRYDLFANALLPEAWPDPGAAYQPAAGAGPAGAVPDADVEAAGAADMQADVADMQAPPTEQAQAPGATTAGSDDGGGDDATDTAVTGADAEPQALHWVSSQEDYQFRPRPAMDHLCPYVMTMLYNKGPATAAQQAGTSIRGHALHFTDGHPERTCKVLRRRADPVLPRACTTIPQRPPPDAHPDERQHYAAFILANFTSDRTNRPRLLQAAGQDMWSALQRWEEEEGTKQQARSGGVLLHIVRNLESFASTRARGAQRAQIRREQLRLAQQLVDRGQLNFQVTTAEPHCTDLAAVEAGSDYEEADDGTAATTEEELNSMLEAALQAEVVGSLSSYAQTSRAGFPDDCIPEQRSPTTLTSYRPPDRGTARAIEEACKDAACGTTVAEAVARAQAPRQAATHHAAQGPLPPARIEVFTVEELQKPGTPFADDGQPIYKLMPSPPTVDETCALFRLSADQEAPFQRLAGLLEAAAKGEPHEQVLMLISGPPGTGKSRIITALDWWAFQTGHADAILKTAYSWRAATALSSPASTAQSAATTFGIDTYQGDAVRSGSNVRCHVEAALHPGVVLLVSDEYTFYSAQFLGAVSRSCTAARCMQPARAAAGHAAAAAAKQTLTPPAYGNLSHVLLGDAEQHDPVTGKPLHWRAHAERQGAVRTLMDINAKNPKAAEGRDLFLQHQEVYLLETQHRQTSTPEGRLLQGWCDRLRQPSMTRADVQEFVEFLNSRAVTNVEDYINRTPHVATLRNTVRPDLNYRLSVLLVGRCGIRLQCIRVA